MIRSAAVVCLTIGLGLGCSEGSGEEETPGGATGGAAAGSGGSSNQGTGGDDSVDETATLHCTPGDTYGVIAYNGLLKNCGRVGGGVGDDQFAARSINIESPIGPGDTYAFSVDTLGDEIAMEIWGSNEECGDGLELLASGTSGDADVTCFEMAPQDGTYTHLTWVWYDGGVHDETTLCPAGTCGR